MATNSSNKGSVQSLERAGAVLNKLLAEARPMSALEIARSTDLHRTIVHRLLRTMMRMNMVVETGPGQYYLGPAMLLFGRGFLDRLPIQRVALPYIVDLSNRVVSSQPWVVALAVPVGTDAVLVERLWQPDAPLDSLLALGTRLPFTSSAHGRAILSTYPDDEVVELIGEEQASKLAGRLKEIRERAHLDFADSEFLPGLAAAAVAVRNDSGRAVGSIAVSGLQLEAELTPDSEIGKHLTRTARAISSVLPPDA